MIHRLSALRPYWLGLAIGFVLVLVILPYEPGRFVIRGLVLDETGSVSGAVVRVRGEAHFTVTDAQGNFELPLLTNDAQLTAWSPGHYITGSENALPVGTRDAVLRLRKHPVSDNPDYQFISPSLDVESQSTCNRCHTARSGPPILPVDEWLQDAHSGSAVNPRFLSLYNGTTVDGQSGIPTLYHFDVEVGMNVPVAPSLGQGTAGPGFRLDFSDQTGPCSTCHVPILALAAPYQADPNHAIGVAQEGVTCDFCHKLWDVRLGIDGKPSPNLPGVLSLQFLRPQEGEQVFLGPLDDTPGDDIYSPLQNRSQFCAACHTGTFWGVSMYDSFGEWLASPYSDPTSGKTCQDCHMPHVGATVFAQLPADVAGVVPQRDPLTIFSHRMPGAGDSQLLQNTAYLEVDTRAEGSVLHVTARVTNTGAGHHIPTDNPLRNMILVIDAVDGSGKSLKLIAGPVIPEWGGVGEPENGHYAGLPGVLYAKVLADFYTGEMPTFAYWRQTRLISDNRIPALATDISNYEFSLPETGSITVKASLVLRRAFIDLMEIKGWDTPDMLMAEQTVMVEQ